MPADEYTVINRRAQHFNTQGGFFSRCAADYDKHSILPERKLLKVFLHRGLADASGRTGQCGESYYSQVKVNIRLDAIDWILNSVPEKPFSFRWTMEELDYPEELIEAIKAEARIWYKDVAEPTSRRPSVWL